MFKTFKTFIVAATLTASVGTIPVLVDTVHADPRIVLTGMTIAERQMAMHAVGLFEQAHLPLPRLIIRRHHDPAFCGGREEGLHTKKGRLSIIDICTRKSDSHEERVMLHELGHAWTFHYMTRDQRDAFQAVRKWRVWNDYQPAAWEDNGAEQAAEIIVWALSDRPVPVEIYHSDCAQLRAGYEALTGREPLHGHEEMCRTIVRVNRS